MDGKAIMTTTKLSVATPQSVPEIDLLSINVFPLIGAEYDRLAESVSTRIASIFEGRLSDAERSLWVSEKPERNYLFSKLDEVIIETYSDSDTTLLSGISLKICARVPSVSPLLRT